MIARVLTLLLCILLVESYGLCPAVTSKTVNLSCAKNGAEVACDNPMSDGTVISTTCKDRHFSTSDINRRITCRNGDWDNLIPVCIPDCGMEKGEAMPYSIGGVDVRRGEVPWHAGIYSHLGGSPKQICGGTIITVNIVVSAAHCFWNDRRNTLNPATVYEVAVGKIFRDYSNTEDDGFRYVQRSNVQRILVPAKYSGNERHYQADIALLIVDKPFTFSHSVHPACLDLSNKTLDDTQIAQGQIGKTVGWGIAEDNKPSNVLKTVNLPVVEFSDCQRVMPRSFQQYLTLDKMCVGYVNGTAICKGDSGGGLMFSTTHGNTIRWYLRGVASVSVPSDKPGSCHSDTYSGFTHVNVHADWIKSYLVEYQQFTTNYGCVLPMQPAYGRYAVKTFPNLKPGNVVPPLTLAEYSCDEEYSLSGSQHVHCNSDGSWSARSECIKMCKPIPNRQSYAELTCARHGRDVSCQNWIETGTVASVYCKSNALMNLMFKQANEITCDAGSWDNNFPICNEMPMDMSLFGVMERIMPKTSMFGNMFG